MPGVFGGYREVNGDGRFTGTALLIPFGIQPRSLLRTIVCEYPAACCGVVYCQQQSFSLKGEYWNSLFHERGKIMDLSDRIFNGLCHLQRVST